MSELESRLPDSAVWEGRTVLVTGHTGFKGSWLTRWLVNLGAQVHGLGLNPPTRPSLFEDARIANALSSDHRVDLRDREAVMKCLRDVAPSVIVHMAAQPLVRDGLRDPAVTFATNVQGTANLLSAIRTSSNAVDAVVVVTTDKVYEPGTVPHREKDVLGGHEPYAWSKVMVEQLVEAFRALPNIDRYPAWNTPMATARAGNVIGGGDWSDERLIPDCIRAFQVGANVRLRFPDAIRPWQHVLEPLAGYLMLAESLLSDRRTQPSTTLANAYNFGPDDDQNASVGHVAQALARLWGEGARVDPEVDTDAPEENPSLRLNSTLAREDLGWRPRWNLATTLERTVEAYQAMTNGIAAEDILDTQILAYMAQGVDDE